MQTGRIVLNPACIITLDCHNVTGYNKTKNVPQSRGKVISFCSDQMTRNALMVYKGLFTMRLWHIAQHITELLLQV